MDDSIMRTAQDLSEKLVRNLRMFSDSVDENVVIGTRPHGTKMKTNFVISLNHKKYAIITKFQFSAGSVDFKLPYEAISLAFSVRASEDIDEGFIILGGTGYSKGMLKFMLDDIQNWIDLGKEIKIIVLDDFIRQLRTRKI
jgi:hypothetical protein